MTNMTPTDDPRTAACHAAGLDPDRWAHRLLGDTPEQLAADAAALAQQLGTLAPAATDTPAGEPGDEEPADPIRASLAARRRNDRAALRRLTGSQ